ncbi:MAG: cell division protein SepF [Ruminococcus flavefaciens]|nr:cell division protein SepF [Ruminococcus flavefaciens]
MKLIDDIKNFFFSTDEDIEDEEMDEPVAPVRKPAVEPPHKDEPEETSAPTPPPAHEPVVNNNSSERINSGNGRRNKVVNIQTTAQLQVVLVKPSAFTDAKQIADHLIAKKTVVLNLETASPENKRRIIDFLVGVAYANGGSLKPVANLTYIITPYNVGFIGEDLVGELENNGVFI